MKLKDFDLETIGLLATVAAALLLLLAVAVGVGGHLYSSLDCEFRPTTERCTVLHERAKHENEKLRPRGELLR